MNAQWGPSVSKNPFVQFSFKGGKSGDEIAVTWIDNKGDKRTDKAAIS
jgi:sulfur-oxidizing protein SoxZ